MKNSGKIIVLDGGDGSGKATQAKELLAYLLKNNYQAKTMSFPRYNTFYGELIGKCLKGEYGDFMSLSPYIVSPLYAYDRLFAKTDIEEYLKSGGILILDRYVTSNMAHQGGKFNTKKDREDFIQWLMKMEYEINQIPKEDIVLYLYVNRTTAHELLKNVDKNEYKNKNEVDISENNQEHQMNTEKMYLYLCDTYTHWEKINCMHDNVLLPINTVHEKIVSVLKSKNIIQ